jgi:hypothetical protein
LRRADRSPVVEQQELLPFAFGLPEARVLAIDPGPSQSAWLVWSVPRKRPIAHGIEANAELLIRLRNIRAAGPFTVVIEKIEGMGMAVGAETFETVYWSGRFAEAARAYSVERIGRRDVKTYLCGSARAKDPNVRTRLCDLFGGEAVAKGNKAAPGPLYGIHADIWSALAVAVVWTATDR